LIWFQKGENNIIDRIALTNPIEIVIGNTGKVTDTKTAVEGVKKRKELNQQKYKEIFDRAENIAYLAKRAIQDKSFMNVGKLMNENHKLLQQIEVSSRELDFLVNIARDSGAFGAKLTGGGLGGNMIALTPGKELQNKVATAIEKEGFQTVKTVIGASRESVE
jgi:mevalonate kinase